MNVNARLLLVAPVLAVSAAAADEQVRVEELPVAVRETISSTHLGGTIRQVTRRSDGGRTVYDVEIDSTRIPHLTIAEDGSFVREPVVPLLGPRAMRVAVPDLAEVAPALRLVDLPPAVQDTVKTRAKGREIAAIERETSNRRTVYKVEFRDGGVDAPTYIAEDGSVVRDEHAQSGHRAVPLQETPAPVQEAVKRIAGARPIVNIEREGTSSAPVYRVELKGAQGVQAVRIRPDGSLVDENRLPEPTRRGQ